MIFTNGVYEATVKIIKNGLKNSGHNGVGKNDFL
jgi:hypothetical protein